MRCKWLATFLSVAMVLTVPGSENLYGIASGPAVAISESVNYGAEQAGEFVADLVDRAGNYLTGLQVSDKKKESVSGSAVAAGEAKESGDSSDFEETQQEMLEETKEENAVLNLESSALEKTFYSEHEICSNPQFDINPLLLKNFKNLDSELSSTENIINESSERKKM